MILHISYHKEGRDFSVRPVTGNYTDVHFYITIEELRYSPCSQEKYEKYKFAITIDNAKEVVEKINSTAGATLAIIGESVNEIRISSNLFPKVLAEMPSRLPQYYPTNPTRLVEIVEI